MRACWGRTAFRSASSALEKGAITVALGEAKKDIEATHRVAVLVLSPLTGGLGPQVTRYAPGFQKARNFLVNAADGESLKLPVTTQGNKMIGQNIFSGCRAAVLAGPRLGPRLTRRPPCGAGAGADLDARGASTTPPLRWC